MSRLSRNAVPFGGTTFSITKINEGSLLAIKGKLGESSVVIPDHLELDTKEGYFISEKAEFAYEERRTPRYVKSIMGTVIRLIEAAIKGVTVGYSKKVQLSGVGFKAALEGKNLRLKVGLSHDVVVEIASGVTVRVPSAGLIEVFSIDKQKLGQFVKELCEKKDYNVYTGSGILDPSRFARRKPVQKK